MCYTNTYTNIKGRISDSEWSRILKVGGLVILNGAVY